MRTPRRPANGASTRRGHTAFHVSGGVGPPALAAMALSALGASMLFIFGVVEQHALGLTPVVFLAAALFFVVTSMAYVEGNSVHPEQGGASTLARYAFDELWSFVAGWAIILDYLIVMAIAVLAVPHYLEAFWGEFGEAPWDVLVALAAMAWVCWANVRGVGADRFGRVLRLGLVFLAIAVAMIVATALTDWNGQAVVDSVDLGTRPEWGDLLFASVLAGAAAMGIEAASGLSPELRTDRAGLKRLVVFINIAVLVLLVGVAIAASAAVPPLPGQTLSAEFLEAPLLGAVSGFDPGWLAHAFRYVVGAVGALVLLQAVNGTMLGLSRQAYSLATYRQIPSLLGRLHPN